MATNLTPLQQLELLKLMYKSLPKTGWLYQKRVKAAQEFARQHQLEMAE